MTYLIVGETSLIQKEVDSILAKETNVSLIKYDLLEVSLNQILEELNTLDLFGNKKVVVVSNFKDIEGIDNLIKYLDNQTNNILILEANEISSNKKSKIKNVIDKSKLINTSSNDLESFIKDSLKEYKIDYLTIQLLKEYCDNNYYRLKQELNKLKMLKLEEKEITKDDIINNVKKEFDKNIFDLTNAINKDDKKALFEIYYGLINDNEDELKIMSILANNFRTLYKVKVLIKNNSDDECMKLLNISNPYRLKMLKQTAYNYSENDLLGYLKDLSDLDIAIKSGKTNKKIGLELYLSNL